MQLLPYQKVPQFLNVTDLRGQQLLPNLQMIHHLVLQILTPAPTPTLLTKERKKRQQRLRYLPPHHQSLTKKHQWALGVYLGYSTMPTNEQDL